MGLMSGNPYYAGNGIAEGINGFIGGYQGAQDRVMAQQKLEADMANQLAIRNQQQQMIDMQMQAEQRKRADDARTQGVYTDVQARLAPRPLVDAGGMPTALGEGFLPPEFKEQFAGPYANASQAVQQVSNPEWDSTLAWLQQKKDAPALPLSQNEALSFGARLGDKNIWEKVLPKDNSEWYNKLYESGKYKPESIAAFAKGTGKLEFADKETWSEPYKGKIGGKEVLLRKNGAGKVELVGQDSSATTKISMNTPDGGEIETLAQMVAKGEMDASQLPKRQGLFNNVVARAKQINPSLNVRNATADFSLSKNGSFRNRALIAETLPEIMDNMVEAGKKVNYPDAKFAGVVKQWGLGQINDPELTGYMATRNDALMTIASVMRGNGMTDMAHKAEVEASNPTMSPRALDAWLAAQKKALAPRLKQNRQIIGNRSEAPAPPANRKPLSAY